MNLFDMFDNDRKKSVSETELSGTGPKFITPEQGDKVEIKFGYNDYYDRHVSRGEVLQIRPDGYAVVGMSKTGKTENFPLRSLKVLGIRAHVPGPKDPTVSTPLSVTADQASSFDNYKKWEKQRGMSEGDFEEGYKVVPDIDRERYTDLSHEGLEGPTRLKSGKVVYYDPAVGQYYDRDSDHYMSHSDVASHNQEIDEKLGSSLVNKRQAHSLITKFKRPKFKFEEDEVEEGLDDELATFRNNKITARASNPFDTPKAGPNKFAEPDTKPKLSHDEMQSRTEQLSRCKKLLDIVNTSKHSSPLLTRIGNFIDKIDVNHFNLGDLDNMEKVLSNYAANNLAAKSRKPSKHGKVKFISPDEAGITAENTEDVGAGEMNTLEFKKALARLKHLANIDKNYCAADTDQDNKKKISEISEEKPKVDKALDKQIKAYIAKFYGTMYEIGSEDYKNLYDELMNDHIQDKINDDNKKNEETYYKRYEWLQALEKKYPRASGALANDGVDSQNAGGNERDEGYWERMLGSQKSSFVGRAEDYGIDPNLFYDAIRNNTISEGAKVDRMVSHIKSNEKKAGKSAKDAENIAWATANKRGMLDNKNKKKHVTEEDNDDHEYHLYYNGNHPKKGMRVNKTIYKNLKSARRAVDKLDNAYGAYAHGHKKVKKSQPETMKESSYNNNVLLESMCHSMTSEQRRIVEGIVQELRPLTEMELNPDQVKQIFQTAQQDSTAAGGNRTAIGQGKDVAVKVNDTINKVGKWLQDTTPVQFFDRKFEELKGKIGKKFPELDSKLTSIGTWAKENPGKTAAIIGVLTTIAALTTGPAGGAIAGQILRGTTELMKGEKLSTAIGKGVKTAAFGYLTGSVLDSIGSWLRTWTLDMVQYTPDIRQAKFKWSKTISWGDAQNGGSQTLSKSLDSGYFLNADADRLSQLVETFNSTGNPATKMQTFEEFRELLAKCAEPEYFERAEIADNLDRALAIANNNLYQNTVKLTKAIAAGAQGAVQAATGNSDQPPEKPVATTAESIDRNLTVYAWSLNESIGLPRGGVHLTNEGIGDMFKSAAGKVGKWAQTKGQNLTTKVTADKLQTAWKKAGSPTDSDEIAKILQNAGVDSEIITQIYTSMKIPAPANADAAPTTGGAGAFGQMANQLGNQSTTAATTQSSPSASAGANAFGQMANQLSKQPSTVGAAPTTPTTSSTGGTIQQKPNGLVHTANPNNPNNTNARAPSQAKQPAATNADPFSHAVNQLGNLTAAKPNAVPTTAPTTAQTTVPPTAPAKQRTGGRVSGQVSQSPNAVRKRNARAAAKATPTTTKESLGPKFGGYYKSTQKGAPRAGQGFGSMEESISLNTTVKAIANDIGEPITSLYATLKKMAKQYYDNNGDLKRFGLVAAGVGSRWFQQYYVNKMQTDLYDLTRQSPSHAAELKQFLRGKMIKDNLVMPKSFSELNKDLPEILARMGTKMGAEALAKNAKAWVYNKHDYEDFINKLLNGKGDDDEGDGYGASATVDAPSKDALLGKQRNHAEEIVNDVLRKLPSKVAGDIRNAIVRAPNKLQALQHELQKRKIAPPMEEGALGNMTKVRSDPLTKLKEPEDLKMKKPDRFKGMSNHNNLAAAQARNLVAKGAQTAGPGTGAHKNKALDVKKGLTRSLKHKGKFDFSESPNFLTWAISAGYNVIGNPAVYENAKRIYNRLLTEEKTDLKPGQYFIWTVHFDDGSSKQVKIKDEKFDVAKYYADKNQVVVNIDYNWEPKGN